MPFSFPQQPPSFTFQPLRYRPHGVGYWSGHLPFACDLIHTLRPATFVELGTHTGESYFAFCQAIDESGVNGRAFAVDTWRGDLHTGSYGEQIFRDVSDWNNRYTRFSSLLRMTFDEAAERFEYDSIDLLHIDGGHTYEIVKHDFELWWPKIKAGGVVVLHDSNERGQDFGVWRWLQEIREGLPAEQFLHSHGLAVVLKPPCEPDSNVAAAFVTARGRALDDMRRYYEMCAAYMQTRYDAVRAPGYCHINSQLFWRSEGAPFKEENSVRSVGLVDASGGTLLLPIPPQHSPVVELRLVPATEPALASVTRYRIESARGELLTEEDGVTHCADWQARGLLAAPGSQGAIIFDETGKNGFIIPLDGAASTALREGGSALLTIAGLEPFTCASEIAAGLSSRHSDSPPERTSLWSRLFAGT